jgi:predicted enzyme related to lactoylglutathione lyase
MTSSVRHTTFDAADPYTLAMFWAQVVGGRVTDEDEPGDDDALVESDGPPLLFVRVPDAKTVKNRVHLDLEPLGSRAEEVRRLSELGASVVDDRVRPDGSGWVVMADPEGNEFCVERGRNDPAG